MKMDIDKALQAAVSGGRFAAQHLLSGNQTLIFATGLTDFLGIVLTDEPEARVADVRRALQDYAGEQARTIAKGD